jgi:cell fate regulator YaaT (PSP1 superfamily)
MRTIGVFGIRGKSTTYRRGDRVIARTSRGLEIADVLCEAADDATELPQNDQGEILRLMSPQDFNECAHIEARTEEEFRICRRQVEEMNLAMELVDLEHIFGGERIIIYYLSDTRVDFRELVRNLAKEFQTRIEMRQIGVRDEAKLLADYGDCGKPVCCNTHLTQMPPVSMKMAKVQKATLDPTKISGRCGRLKCCLRYEYDTYTELARKLPPIGSDVVTPHGNARVMGHDVLAEQILIETEDHRRMLLDSAEVITVIRDNRKSRPRSAQVRETRSPESLSHDEEE